MISVEEALGHLFALATPVGTETVPLTSAAGRVLSVPVIAKRDQPPFRASAMDGYAVQRADLVIGRTLSVIGEASAGAGFDGTVGAGQAARIFTGAPLPDGSESILIQENADRTSSGTLRVTDVSEESFVRPAGGDFAKGHQIAAPRRLRPADLSLAAAMGAPDVTVSRQPRVALIATGNELVQPGETPGPDQIVSSNLFALKAIIEAAGGEAHLLPIARDTHDSLRTAFDLAAFADLIVTTGGASVGDHDLVADVAGDSGVSMAFHKVAMRPGKPLMAGRMGSSVLVGLPGNPVSAVVCGMIFIVPLLHAMQGLPAAPVPRRTARLTADLTPNGPREHYMRAVLEAGQVRALDRQDSSLLSVLSAANALLVRPPHDPKRGVGETVEVIPFA